MSNYPYLSAWLQCLLQLAPPSGLVHVGAGGSARQYPFTNMPRLLALEADAQQHARLQAQLQNHPHGQVLQAVVAGQPGSAEFFTLSQTLESGLCAPAQLQALWPNIKTLHTETLPTTTLQTLLEQTLDGAAAFNWAVIDCLPANELLQGAGELIHGWDVLVVRALKDAAAGANPATHAMSLPALRQQLSVFGLEFVTTEEENHPQLVRALFVRNPALQLAKDKTALTAARDEQAKLATERQTALSTLQTQHDSLLQEKAKLIANSAELAKAKDQLSTQLAAETKARTEALAQRDAEAATKVQAIAQRDGVAKDKAALTSARDEQAKMAAERQAALSSLQIQQDNLVQEKAKLIAESAELAKAKDQLGTQLAAETKARTEALAQRDAEAKAKSEALVQRDTLVKEKAALTAARDDQVNPAILFKSALSTLQTQHDSLVQEKAKLIADSAELAKIRDQLGTQLAAETNARTEALAQRDVEAKAKTEAIARCDAEAKARSEAITQRDTLAKDKAALTFARDEQVKLATERQNALVTLQQDSETKLQRYQRMEADNQEHAMRQQMMQDELIRAEAQIDLIKDLLLREPGL
jgi:uncharacterized protein (DUF3084 family)